MKSLDLAWALSILRLSAFPASQMSHVIWWKLFHGEGGTSQSSWASSGCAGLSCWPHTRLWLQITAVLMPMGMGDGIWALSGQFELYCAFRLASRRAFFPWVESLKEVFCKFFKVNRTLALCQWLSGCCSFINIWAGDSGNPGSLGDLDVLYQKPVLVDLCWEDSVQLQTASPASFAASLHCLALFWLWNRKRNTQINSWHIFASAPLCCAACSLFPPRGKALTYKNFLAVPPSCTVLLNGEGTRISQVQPQVQWLQGKSFHSNIPARGAQSQGDPAWSCACWLSCFFSIVWCASLIDIYKQK